MPRPITPLSWKGLLAGLLVGWSAAGCATTMPVAHSQFPLFGDDDQESEGFTVPLKTLGGRQFWTDVAYFHDWSIQQNVLFGQYRLLDGDDYRHASGTLEECQAKLKEIREARKLEPMSGKAVILIHGIIRSSKSMDPLKKPFQQAGYHVFSFEYASTQEAIPKAAANLHKVIESLEGIEEINFVVHSMGGLVVRAYLKDRGEKVDERIKRMVMIGVPNRGAALADMLKTNKLFQTIFGPAGQQLVSDPEGFVNKLPAPEFEFAIIAGGKGTLKGYNPLVPGDDDGTVSVNSTRLEGAADFIRLRGIHSFLMRQKPVIEASVRFIRDGKLRESGEMRPIAREE